jgi:hypothetical protein
MMNAIYRPIKVEDYNRLQERRKKIGDPEWGTGQTPFMLSHLSHFPNKHPRPRHLKQIAGMSPKKALPRPSIALAKEDNACIGLVLDRHCQPVRNGVE